jgi:hypothetical protein
MATPSYRLDEVEDELNVKRCMNSSQANVKSHLGSLGFREEFDCLGLMATLGDRRIGESGIEKRFHLFLRQVRAKKSHSHINFA